MQLPDPGNSRLGGLHDAVLAGLNHMLYLLVNMGPMRWFPKNIGELLCHLQLSYNRILCTALK